MRLFIIEEQLKFWLFDLDGNVFHLKLRDNIKIGMIVGIRVSPKQIISNNQYKEIDLDT